MATPFNLTEQDVQSATKSDDADDEAMMDRIPILKRRAAAAEANKKSDGADSIGSKNEPICVIVVGMAGSGKTTLMAQLQRSLNLKARDGEKLNGGKEDDGEEDEVNDDKKPSASSSSDEAVSSDSSRVGYAINLDPAAKYVPFTSSIDIRDTVDYLEVMRQHKLGPNGAILTCLNLFATKFDQVMGILEHRAFGSNAVAATVDSLDPPSTKSPLDYILIDTPGQIEAFTWSASGTIVTSSLATAFPTVLAFVVDTPRCAASVHTFMSNMLYACSMLYRAKLPMVVVLNKTDVVGCEFIKE
ncbi:hypothetical protein ACHAXR_013424 [Thalassiosira sp. AJA248-18]